LVKIITTNEIIITVKKKKKLLEINFILKKIQFLKGIKNSKFINIEI
jgi:hypothetical protein